MSEIIYFEGHVAAVATEVGIVFSVWVAGLDRDDPVWKFIAAAAACAYDVANGVLDGPYSEALGTAYARGTWVGAGQFDSGQPSGLSDRFPPSTVRSL